MRNLLPFLVFMASMALGQTAFAHGPAGHHQTHQNPAPRTFAEGEPVSGMVSVLFADNSTAFRPTPEQAEMLVDAKDAAMVTINGRTSTNKASLRDEALALARAVSARAWLVERGVSPLKIMINYASATDYAADNTTLEGRKLNQRVEVEVFFIPRH